MGLRIFIPNPVVKDHFGADAEVVRKGVMKATRMVARPDTEITWSDMEKAYGAMWFQQWASVEMLNSTDLLRKIVQAEQEGYDAAVVSCVNDPALHLARGLVDIPVTMAGEAGFMVAQLLGRKFGMVTISDYIVSLIEGNLRFLGFLDRAIENRPVRAFDMKPGFVDAMKGKPERLISDFEKVATEMVRDGADVLVAGCGLLGPALTLAGYNEVPGCGVPVVDPNAAAVKLAELLADFRKSLGIKKSSASTGLYRTPPAEVKEALQRDFWRETPGKLTPMRGYR